MKLESCLTKLLERYADGRQLCNCRRAYYSNTGRGVRWVGDHYEDVHNMPVCMGGCSANQISATEYVTYKAFEEILKLEKKP